MKKTRLFAWLLIAAMLAAACPAFGEALDVELELPDGGAEETLAVETTAGAAAEDALEVEFDLLPEDLDAVLPEIELNGDLLAADAAANGEMDGERVLRLQVPGGADNDALFAGYVDTLFGKRVRKNGYVGDGLKGTAKQFYDYLAPLIVKVAAGKRTDTRFVFPAEMTPDFSWDAYWNAIIDGFDALLADYPYHLYWFDKVRGIPPEYRDGHLILPFTVAQEYAADTFETDPKKTQAAHIAVKNAKKVVKKYAGVSDYKKLCGYRDYICDAVDYNYAAIEDSSTPYGNPWQLIWTFDDDPSTKVVCEGYSKSFQYLCDLSAFNDDIRAYSVTGEGGTNPDNWGAHMWNIVTMEDGKNYHVDITFCDGGLMGDFLVGSPDVTEKGGAFYTVNGQACYHFDQNTLSTTYPANLLKLSKKDYDPDKPEPASISIAQGNSATLYMGNTLALKVKTTPKNAVKALKWKSSKPEVATVNSNGTVTPKQAGKTTITVKTANGKSAKIVVRVVDAKRVRFKEGAGKNLTVYKKTTLHVLVSPSKVKTKLTWTTSDAKVAVVSQKGVVRGVSCGVAIITATTANGKPAKIRINVVGQKPEDVYEVKE